MENIFYGLIVILLLANLYFVTRKETEEDNKDDEYLIKGIVSEIIENEESQIYKLLNRSDQTVKDFLEKTRLLQLDWLPKVTFWIHCVVS